MLQNGSLVLAVFLAIGVVGCGSSDGSGDPSDAFDGEGSGDTRTVDDVTQSDSPPLSQVLLRCDEAGGLTGEVEVLTGPISNSARSRSGDLSDSSDYETLRENESTSTVEPASPNCRTVTHFISNASNNDDYAGFGLRTTTAFFNAGRVEVEEDVAEIAGAFQTTYENMGVLTGPIEVPVYRRIDHPEQDMRGWQATLIIRTTGNMRITSQRNFVANELTEDPLVLPASPESGSLADFAVNISAFDGAVNTGGDRAPRFFWFGFYPLGQGDIVNTEREDLQTGTGLASGR